MKRSLTPLHFGPLKIDASRACSRRLWAIRFFLIENTFGVIEKLYSKILKVDQREFKHPPIFILGHHRSGTTFLQNLFLANPQYSSPRLYDVLFPDILLIGNKTLRPLVNLFLKLAPPYSELHRQHYDLDFPSEEDIALLNMQNPMSYNWAHLYPKNLEAISQKTIVDLKYGSADELIWRKDYLHFLKKFNSLFPNQRLLLKSPPNLGRARLLSQIFPEAKFIFIMRDPYELYPSMQRFWDISDEFSFQEVASCNKDELIFPESLRLFRKYFEDKSFIAKENLIEIRYSDLKSNPLSTIERIYKTLNIGSFEAHKKSYTEYLSNRSKIGLKTQDRGYPKNEKVDLYWKELVTYYNSIDLNT